MDELRARIGADRLNRIFDRLPQSDDSPSADTPGRKVLEVSSSDDDATVTEEPAGHARQAGTSTTSSPRKRRKKTKPSQGSPSKERHAPMSGPRPTRILPTDPDPSDNPSTSSSSTRQSTNQGKRAGAYNTSGLRNGFGLVDNGFDNDKPGQQTSSTSSYGNARTHRAPEKLPSFQRDHSNGGTSFRSIPTSSSLRFLDKENRDNATRSSYQSTNIANGFTGVPQGIRSDKPPISIVGAAAKNRQAQGSRPLPEDTLSRSAQSTSTASTSKRSLNVDSTSASFMPLVPTATSTAAASLDKGKGKAKSDVIELDDESDGHDSIQDDSDASGPRVQTSKASSRARMNSGPSSSASRAIPNGNTQAKKTVFEGPTKQQGTTIHQRPPSHKPNTSVSDDESLDSFSLSKDKPEKRVNSMQSRGSNSTSTPNPRSKPKIKKDIFRLPLQCIVTVDGTYIPMERELDLVVNAKGKDQCFFLSGGCKHAGKNTRTRGSVPKIGDVVISPDHIACITVPQEPGHGMTFMRIDIDADADASESSDPKSPFYFFQIHSRGTPQALDVEFNAVKEYLRGTSRDVFRVEWVTNQQFGSLFSDARERATAYANEMKESDSRGRESLRQSTIKALMNPSREHDHQLEDVPGEDSPIVVGLKPRPRARPSAGSTLPSSFQNHLTVQQSSHRKATSSTTTVSSSEDNSSESGIDISKPGKKVRSSATNRSLVTDETNSRKTAKNRQRQSNSPELLSDKALRSSGQRQTRISKTNADSKIMKTALSDLDDEGRPDPKLWKGRLEPEEETALVFPREGTGAVTVINSDINRLAPGEFLNDTLIEYGMKRIWQRIRDSDPTYADQIHMFSSFFYKKLSTRDRKTKTEPYKTVRKWTSKIDLFQKKYIFVPINEYFHWYLAIIVNPGRILKPPPPPIEKATPLKRATRSSQEGASNPAEVDPKAAPINVSRFFSSSQTDTKGLVPAFQVHEHLPSPELPETDRSPTPSLEGMDVDGDIKREGKTPLLTSDLAPEQAGSTTKSMKPPTDSAINSGNPAIEGTATTLDDKVKGLNLNSTTTFASISDLDDERCYIITLDSLHSKHPGVIQNLKNYLISEAKDKGKLLEDAVVPVNEADGVFRGMAAAVPQQPNMSDCGLYVLHFAEVFLQNAEELMPIMMKKVKKAPEDTNTRWHYEKAEKKRAVFYDELIQESKDWKEWRAKKLAEKASETEEDELHDAGDEGEDIEMIQQASEAREPRLPEKPAKKGKLRRYSDPESADSEAPQVTSTRRAVTPTRARQHTSSSNKTVVVEIPSPSRQNDNRRRPSPADTDDMLVDTSSDMHKKPSSRSLPLVIPESPQKAEAFDFPFGSDLLNTIRGKVDRAPNGDGLQGIDRSAVLPSSLDPSRGESVSANGLAASALEEDSGSEDSRAEVTDDDVEGSRMGTSDAIDDSFRAQMISPVGRSQEVAQSRQSGLSRESSIENFQPNPSLYQVRTSTPDPNAVSLDLSNELEITLGQKAMPVPEVSLQDYLNKVKSTLGEKATAAPKRHLSTDSDTLSSPLKTDKSPAHKRSRRNDPSAPIPPVPYNPKRMILQSPSPAPEDASSRVTDSAQSGTRINERSRVPPSSTPAKRPPSSSQINSSVIDISDEEEELASTEVPSGRTSSAPFPSQRVRSRGTYDEAGFVREKLGRIER